MSIFTKSEKYAHPAPGSAYDPNNPALQFYMIGRGLANITYHNLGKEIFYPVPQSGNNMTIKIQDSADGLAWADVVGTVKTVVPMGEVGIGSVTLRQYWRVLAYGNTEGVVKVDIDETLDLVKI